MDIAKALALSAERMRVKPKDARRLAEELPLSTQSEAIRPRPAKRSGPAKSDAERHAANRRIVEKARAQLSHTLLLLR